MNKEIVKKAYSEAEKELREEQDAKIKEQVKDIVKTTLEKIEDLKEKKNIIDKDIKILKMDIDDLKEGKLDRIQERQEQDPNSRAVSVVVIHKKTVKEHVPYWYQPYVIDYNIQQPLEHTKFYCGTGDVNTYDNTTGSPCFTVTNSVAKDSVIGTYKVKKKIIHLR